MVNPLHRKILGRRFSIALVALLLGHAVPALAEKPANVRKPLSLEQQQALAMLDAGSTSAVKKVVPHKSAKAQKGRSLRLKSAVALVVDEDSGEVLVDKNADNVVPIASLTKLMTALVVLDARQSMSEMLEVSVEDVDTIKRTPSRLKVGTRLTRGEMLLLALMSSENRAAAALSRYYSGGRKGFISAMNAKARMLGMKSSYFAEAAGLSNRSVSTARDLHLLLTAAYAQPLIREYSTRLDETVKVNRRHLNFVNSNRMVRYSSDWDIQLQKTGFTNEAGRCLMMQAKVEGRRLGMVFLDSDGKLSRYGDAARVRQQISVQERTTRKRASS